MQDAKNLIVAERAQKVAMLIYRLTADFPPAERFGLTSQMRRAAVSVGSNISEGCGRRSNRELLHFLFIAMGSASELQYQCNLARGLVFGDPAALDAAAREIDRLKAMLSRLITALRRQPARRPV
ncbi:MAG TPA: four helix bundle protein [Gemmatimonadaceae bacterium]|jgi:four helix bundle protein